MAKNRVFPPPPPIPNPNKGRNSTRQLNDVTGFANLGSKAVGATGTNSGDTPPPACAREAEGASALPLGLMDTSEAAVVGPAAHCNMPYAARDALGQSCCAGALGQLDASPSLEWASHGVPREVFALGTQCSGRWQLIGRGCTAAAL